MSHSKSLWLRAAVPVAVLALSLTACGSDDDGDGDDGGMKANKPNSGPSKPSKAGMSPEPKRELGAGESASVTFKEEAGAVTYDVLAEKATVGTAADTRRMVDDPAKAKGMVPVVAHVKFTNKGGGTVAEYPEVGDRIEVYADGQRGTVLIGASEDEPGCEDDSDIENWAPGKSHVMCDTYMIPEDAKSVEVHWAPEEGEPYIWKFPTT